MPKSFFALQEQQSSLFFFYLHIYKYIYTYIDIYIPHQNFKSLMGKLINFSFNGGVKEFIGITKYGAIWTNDQQKHFWN